MGYLNLFRVTKSGGFSGWETPDPIPNSAVKPASADDTSHEGK